jgi:hypothetical protein
MGLGTAVAKMPTTIRATPPHWRHDTRALSMETAMMHENTVTDEWKIVNSI